MPPFRKPVIDFLGSRSPEPKLVKVFRLLDFAGTDMPIDIQGMVPDIKDGRTHVCVYICSCEVVALNPVFS